MNFTADCSVDQKTLSCSMSKRNSCSGLSDKEPMGKPLKYDINVKSLP